jgi:transposase
MLHNLIIYIQFRVKSFRPLYAYRVTRLFTTYLQATTMNARRALQPLEINRVQNSEYTPRNRGQFCALSFVGLRQSEIASLAQIPRTSIQYTLAKTQLRTNDETLPRSGRPSILSARNKRSILRLIRRNPKICWKNLLQELNIDCSKSTIQRFLKEQGIKKWLAAKRPLLKEEHAEKRLAWAKDRKNWTERQ